MVVVLPRDAVEELVQRVRVVDGPVAKDLDGDLLDREAGVVEQLVQRIQLQRILSFLCDVLRLRGRLVDLVVLDDDGDEHHHAADEGPGGDADAHERDAIVAEEG